MHDLEFQATDWPDITLGEVCTFRGGNGFKESHQGQSNGDHPFIKVSDLTLKGNEKYITTAQNWVCEDVLRELRATLQPVGAVVFAKVGAALKLNRRRILTRPTAIDNNMMAAIPDTEKLDGDFLYYFLLVQDLGKFSQESAVPSVNQGHLSAIEISLPPLPEQRKIAAILRTWDEALEKLNALRAAKARQLDGLAQTTMGRGGAFPAHWQRKPLSEVSTPVKRKSEGGDHPVMTISAKSGFLMQADKFARNMAGRSVERYTLLQEGEFAYNKGNSKTAPYGCVFRLDRDTALVPFVYYCFALKPGLDPEFYDHLFAAGALNHQLSRLINSGVRNDGLLNLYSDDFFSCRVPVPPIEEQKRIAQALTTAKRELELLDEEIAALTDQKRGLMQKLLTGEWRVEVDPAEIPRNSKEAEHAG
jgi:type I restriction enzyme S subunit